MVSAQSLSNGPTLHPVKVKGGVERGVPFTLLGCRLIFASSSKVFTGGHTKKLNNTRAVFW